MKSFPTFFVSNGVLVSDCELGCREAFLWGRRPRILLQKSLRSFCGIVARRSRLCRSCCREATAPRAPLWERFFCNLKIKKAGCGWVAAIRFFLSFADFIGARSRRILRRTRAGSLSRYSSMPRCVRPRALCSRGGHCSTAVSCALLR